VIHKALGISGDNCHIRIIDVDGCKAVVQDVENRREEMREVAT